MTKQQQQGKHFTDSFFDVGNVVPARDNNVEFDCPESYAEWCVEDFDTSKGGVSESDYVIVNLLENPETYTAYEGSPIWDAIYQENCLLDKTFGTLQGLFNAETSYLVLLRRALAQAEACTDETLLYYLMSGLHASVNTHISNAFVDPETQESSNNQTYFLEKVGNHEDRVRNLHFIYAAVVKAVSMMEPVLLNIDLSSGIDERYDPESELLLRDLLRKVNSRTCDQAFKEKSFFQNSKGEAAQLELLGDIQHAFYNISRIMDCISCAERTLNNISKSINETFARSKLMLQGFRIYFL